MSDVPVGRPRVSSREVIAEAACELFLEQGFEATSVTDITTRAGLSRSSFFNYFASKADVLWASLDERIDALERRLREDDTDAARAVDAAVRAVGDDFAPDSLALAFAHASTMGLTTQLERESALRSARIARAVSARLRRGGFTDLRAAVWAAAYGGALLAAIERWAFEGPGTVQLASVVARAVSEVRPLGDVRRN